MIIKNSKTISSIYKGSEIIEKLYKGTLLVYESWKKLVASGVSPLTLLNCKGVDLIDYKLYGNSVQEGTPTPEAPIEVESVGEYDTTTGKYKIPVITRSRNVLRFPYADKTKTQAGVNWNVNNDRSVTVSGLPTGYSIFVIASYMEIESNTDYTFNFGVSEDAENLTFEIWGYDSNRTQIYSVSGNTKYESGRKIIYNDIHIDGMSDAKYITIQVKRSQNNTDTYGTFKPTLEKGNVNTSYDAYVEPITTNIYLNEPLRKVGDYADYIQKEIKIIDGKEVITQKVVRKISKYIFNETAPYLNTSATKTEGYQNYQFVITLYNWLGSTPVLSSKLPGDKNWNYGNATKREQLSAAEQVVILRIAESRGIEFSVAGIKVWLKENPIDIFYPMKTPTEETIELPNIPTTKGTTILEVDTKIQPSNAEVTYKGK